MRTRYPVPGDIYRSDIYPDQLCRVATVRNALVTFEWLGRYAHVEAQAVSVVQFTRDFTHESPKPSAAGTR